MQGVFAKLPAAPVLSGEKAVCQGLKIIIIIVVGLLWWHTPRYLPGITSCAPLPPPVPDVAERCAHPEPSSGVCVGAWRKGGRSQSIPVPSQSVPVPSQSIPVPSQGIPVPSQSILQCVHIQGCGERKGACRECSLGQGTCGSPTLGSPCWV